MSFMTAISYCLKAGYADFDSRSSKSEFWFFILFYIAGIILSIAISLGLEVVRYDWFGYGDLGHYVVLSPLLIFLLYTLIPYLAVIARRFHDQNLSGWWTIVFTVLGWIPIVNIISFIVFIIFMALDGTVGPNRFGRDPIEENNVEIENS